MNVIALWARRGNRLYKHNDIYLSCPWQLGSSSLSSQLELEKLIDSDWLMDFDVNFASLICLILMFPWIWSSFCWPWGTRFRMVWVPARRAWWVHVFSLRLAKFKFEIQQQIESNITFIHFYTFNIFQLSVFFPSTSVIFKIFLTHQMQMAPGRWNALNRN